MLQSSYAIISFKVTAIINLPINFMTFDVNNGLATYIYDIQTTWMQMHSQRYV